MFVTVICWRLCLTECGECHRVVDDSAKVNGTFEADPSGLRYEDVRRDHVVPSGPSRTSKLDSSKRSRSWSASWY